MYRELIVLVYRSIFQDGDITSFLLQPIQGMNTNMLLQLLLEAWNTDKGLQRKSDQDTPACIWCRGRPRTTAPGALQPPHLLLSHLVLRWSQCLQLLCLDMQPGYKAKRKSTQGKSRRKCLCHSLWPLTDESGRWCSGVLTSFQQCLENTWSHKEAHFITMPKSLNSAWNSQLFQRRLHLKVHFIT